jgi:hypothetical protein
MDVRIESGIQNLFEDGVRSMPRIDPVDKAFTAEYFLIPQ